MTAKQVLSVGQCLADSGSLKRTFLHSFGVEVVSADDAAEAISLLHGGDFALVLVNRVFDADGSSGLDLIRSVRGDEALRSVPIMLVSNYPEAQAEAVAAGALPGFGKAVLGQASMLARVAKVLGNQME
jgi:DNA-binding response OmpR family regulator